MNALASLLFALGVAAVALQAPAPAHAQAARESEGVEISASRQGRLVDIRVQTNVYAPHEIIWSTLTDYDNQTRWIPGMKRSVVLERKPGGAIVEQSGHADVLFMSFAVDVVVEVKEFPPERITVQLVRGNFKHLEGQYRITPQGPGKEQFALEWTGTLQPESRAPGFFTMPVLRDNIRHQFESMVNEIHRRAKAAREKAAP